MSLCWGRSRARRRMRLAGSWHGGELWAPSRDPPEPDHTGPNGWLVLGG